MIGSSSCADDSVFDICDNCGNLFISRGPHEKRKKKMLRNVVAVTADCKSIDDVMS